MPDPTPDERISKAVNLADSYGNIDGDHHKMWVIDQMLRALLSEQDYKDLIATRKADGFSWDVGIPP